MKNNKKANNLQNLEISSKNQKSYSKHKKTDFNRNQFKIYDNVWDNRNFCALPNLGWHVDASILDCQVVGNTKSKHVLVSAVDPATNRIIFAKVFYSHDGRKFCTANQVIKLLKYALTTEQIKNKLIIHTDRGGCFTSKNYFDFVSNEPLIIPSMTKGGAPQQNPVIERMFHTIKHQFLKYRKPIPYQVKNTRDLQKEIVIIKNSLNEKSQPSKNYKASPNQMHLILNQTLIKPPKNLFVQNGKTDNLIEQAGEISHFRNLAQADFFDNKNDTQTLYNKLNTLKYNVQNKMNLLVNIQNDLSEQNEKQLEISEEILKNVQVKKKVKHQAIPKRDNITFAIFEEIMMSPRPKNAQRKSWGRFQITCSILFFGGLRINEIASLQYSDIENILKTKKLNLYQKKVNQYRSVLFIDKAIFYIKNAFDQHKEFVFKTDDQLFPKPFSGGYNGNKFINLINDYLAPFSKKHNLVLKSHSFRVNFVTSLLKNTAVQHAQQIIGHKDIRSTIAYNRYKLTPKKQDDILNKAFDENLID